MFELLMLVAFFGSVVWVLLPETPRGTYRQTPRMGSRSLKKNVFVAPARESAERWMDSGRR